MNSYPKKGLGIGLIGLLVSIVSIFLNLMESIKNLEWIIFAIFIIGSLDALFIGQKKLSALGWFIQGLGFIIGFYFGGRWGSLLGLIIGYIIVTPFINKYEYKFF